MTSDIFVDQFMRIHAGILSAFLHFVSPIVHLGVFSSETGSIVAVAISTLVCFSQPYLFFMYIYLVDPGSTVSAVRSTGDLGFL